MKKIALLLVAALAGCATTEEYKGISSNAFPRHSFNYLFNESFALDYTSLKASDWVQGSQLASGAYAVTEIIPKNETMENWQKKFTIGYYPKVTVKKVSTLQKSISYLQDGLNERCKNGHINWKTIENSQDYYIATMNAGGCEKVPDQDAVYRLLQSGAGLNVLIYSQKSDLSSDEMNAMIAILKEAKVVGYTPAPLKKNNQNLSY